MPYYDKIAKQWHQKTGYKGGPFKAYILNDLILNKIGAIQDKHILEIGAGNGYFFPLVMKRYSGQLPASINIGDVSVEQLKIIQKNFRLTQAHYLQLDLYKTLPFENAGIDLIISTMVFNELSLKGLTNGVAECARILSEEGKLILTVLHPEFVERQIANGVINNGKMKGSKGLAFPL